MHILRHPLLYVIYLALIVSQQSDSSRISTIEHPRLFFNQSGISSLQAKAATSHAEIWAPILEQTNQKLGSLPPQQVSYSASEEDFRTFGNSIIPLAFTCTISRDANHCNLAKQTLLRYATWTKWSENSERNLGLAHMIFGNAIAYDWLHSRLTQAEQAQVRTALANWTQQLYEAGRADKNNLDWQNWWRKSYMQNYHWICNSALGMAGLALSGEDARADAWVNEAASQIGKVTYLLNGINDGSLHEGINYQNYALTMLLPFMVNLERIRGQNLFPENYLRNYVLWRVYNQLPGQFYPALAFGDFEKDWGNGYEAQNILRLIASRYRIGLAEWMAQDLLKLSARTTSDWDTPWYVFEFLYYDATVAASPPTSLPRSRVFSDQGSLIWRTGWERDSLVFGLKAGAYGGRFAFNSFVQRKAPWDPACEVTGCQLNIDHDHLDSNGFYLYKTGYWMAPESIGVNKRATSYHNAMLIDGQGQYLPDPNGYDNPNEFSGSDGFLEVISTVPDFDYMMANSTRAYRNLPGMLEIRRHVLFVRPSYFVMLDNLATDAPHRYEWVSHFSGNITVESPWVRGEAGDDQLLGVAVVAPQSFANTIGNDGQPYIRIRPWQNSAHERMIHLLYPTDKTRWNSKPATQLLENRPNWSALRVTMRDGSGRSDDIIFNNGGNQGAGYQFNGNLALISKDSQQRFSKLYMVEGALLADQWGARVLIRRTNPGQSIEAIYSYNTNTLTLYGSVGGSVEIYAPTIQQVNFNGASRSFTRQGDYIQVCLGQC